MPPQLRYPEELVHRFGAKAGILMYVAQHLPDIPQARFAAIEANESADTLLERAARAGIGDRVIIRSSAVEELWGLEGCLVTLAVDGLDSDIVRANWSHEPNTPKEDIYIQIVKERIEVVNTSPQDFQRRHLYPGLPDKIPVILAELKKPEYRGLLIKHPNQKDYYLTTIRINDSGPGRQRGTFHAMHGSPVLTYYPFDHGVEWIYKEPKIREALQQVISWHDQIANLPLMDDTWAYQLEFGIGPFDGEDSLQPHLFQVRPFKPVQYADFELRPYRLPEDSEFAFRSTHLPIVFGVTDRAGIDLKTFQFDPGEFAWDSRFKIRDQYYQEAKTYNTGGGPVLIVDDYLLAFAADSVHNLRANVFTSVKGPFAHNDIRAIRTADVTALFSGPQIKFIYPEGTWVNLVSDGININIRKL